MRMQATVLFLLRNRILLPESDNQIFLTYHAKLLWDNLWSNKDVDKQKQKEP